MKKLLLLFALVLPVAAVAAGGGQQSADALIRRVAQGGARNIVTRIVAGEHDFFEITPNGSQVLITANSAVSAATGFNWYLKYVAGIHLSWNHLTQPLPDNMPLPARTIRQETDMPLRYYLNFCTFSYSMPFWDWERWQQEIDWMAMHGVNMPLDIIGNEVVWRNMLAKAGYWDVQGKKGGFYDTAIEEFISGPAFMAWWQMNNLEGWGGPNPEWWYARQEALQKQIMRRMSELGMTPVLPGFSGMMPRTASQKLGISTVDAGTWNDFYRPSFLDPTDPNSDFDKLADLYYKESERLYGKAAFYAMDPFHEGAKAEGVDIAQAGQKILAAMKRANPAATWVLQAWGANPLPAMTRALPKGDIIILDLQSDKRPQWGAEPSQFYRKGGFEGHDWIFCMLQNFGGRTGLGGSMDDMINGYYDARRQRGSGMLAEGLSGVGATPEAIEQNPVMFELLFELPWRDARFSPAGWLDGYIKARYGGLATPEVTEAWTLLYNTSYNIPRSWAGDGNVESVIAARPGLHLKKASTWGNAVAYYDPSLMEQAADLMWSARDAFWSAEGEASIIDMRTLGAMTMLESPFEIARRTAAVNNFGYDLVDIKRQALADRANKLSDEFSAAYDKNNMNEFGRLAEQFLGTIDEMNELLYARPEFRVDTWINSARAVAPAGKPAMTRKGEWASYADWMEWNARTLITVWGPREAADKGGLHDYSGRQWHGLLDLYAQRWLRFFEAEFDERGSGSKIDWFEMENKWASTSVTGSVFSPSVKSVVGGVSGAASQAKPVVGTTVRNELREEPAPQVRTRHPKPAERRSLLDWSNEPRAEAATRVRTPKAETAPRVRAVRAPKAAPDASATSSKTSAASARRPFWCFSRAKKVKEFNSATLTTAPAPAKAAKAPKAPKAEKAPRVRVPKAQPAKAEKAPRVRAPKAEPAPQASRVRASKRDRLESDTPKIEKQK